MYILQMADLHIGSSIETTPNEDSLVMQCVELVKNTIPKNEEILLCLCGDIIDSKGLTNDDEQLEEVKRRYEKAQKLVKKMQNSLRDDYRLSIKCCMGNHDVTHKDEFYEFVKSIDDTPPSKSEVTTCYTIEISNMETRVIFVNSCVGDQYQIGCIEYDKLEEELKKFDRRVKKIIVLHHTIMSMFEDDSSSIRDAARLVHLIEKYNILGVLHGHIHGQENFKLQKNQSKIIGVGALFTRGNSNVNSQFNIIEVKKDTFLKMLNCRYFADGGNEPWSIKELDIFENKNFFIGESFKNVYEQLINRLDVETPIYNMRIEIKNIYDRFNSELVDYLKEDSLAIGKKKYSYFELAKMWQAKDIPKELYFNHGSYFYYDGKNGVDFIVEQLKNKPTSNRIVLATYNMKDVHKSLDDTNYLPSVDSIQFGKNGDKMVVHMYLRALEAKQFLKINICEIDYLLKQLKEKFVEFEKVEIIVSAFRVQKKENFKCFLKTEIDSLDPTYLTTLVNFKKFSKLCELFEEKRNAKETITKVHGIQTVYESMLDCNKVSQEYDGEEIYDEELVSLLKRVLDSYIELDKIQKSSSIQSKKEQEYEQEIDDLLKSFIEKLKQMEEV